MIKVAFNQHLYKYGQSCPGEAQIPCNPSEGDPAGSRDKCA